MNTKIISKLNEMKENLSSYRFDVKHYDFLEGLCYGDYVEYGEEVIGSIRFEMVNQGTLIWKLVEKCLGSDRKYILSSFEIDDKKGVATAIFNFNTPIKMTITLDEKLLCQLK